MKTNFWTLKKNYRLSNAFWLFKHRIKYAPFLCYSHLATQNFKQNNLNLDCEGSLTMILILKDDESNKYLEAWDRRYLCLNSIAVLLTFTWIINLSHDALLLGSSKNWECLLNKKMIWGSGSKSYIFQF